MRERTLAKMDYLAGRHIRRLPALVRFTLLTVSAVAYAAECSQSGNLRLPISMEVRTPAFGPQGLIGDGQAAYSDGVQNVLASVYEAHYVQSCDPAARNCRRSLTFNLDSPVAPAPALGTVRDFKAEFAARWYLDVNNAMHSVQDIPVGQTVVSGVTFFRVHLNGVPHLLLFGDTWALGACGTNGEPLITGSVTPAYIKRLSATEWTVISSPNSMGKLVDYSNPPAPVDKGFYYFNFSAYMKLKSKRKQ